MVLAVLSAASPCWVLAGGPVPGQHLRRHLGWVDGFPPALGRRERLRIVHGHRDRHLECRIGVHGNAWLGLLVAGGRDAVFWADLLVRRGAWCFEEMDDRVHVGFSDGAWWLAGWHR